jgi:CheY-like chemotaxis protein/HPt (histidine-containing phosphotransfer) domain-containing protein/anti-sigma regulatory factor (Ser/Thr protein kinase)
MIYVASKQLLELLNSVLDIVSADHMNENHVHYETFSLQALLSHLGDLMQASIKTKNIQLRLMLDQNLPSYIVSDQLKLERILQNLLGNAIKFTNQGLVSIEAKLIAKSEDNVQIEFCITDTGIGIPENQKQQIFERFFRATPSYEGVYQGHGVGLYIVKKFVSLLGGEIRVDSELGKGTSFRFALTMQIGNQQDAVPIHDDIKSNIQPPLNFKPTTIPPSFIAKEISESSHGTQILFIEDNEIARYTGQVLLQNAGYIVQAVESAEIAMTLVKSRSFDLIISDLGLPGIQGDEMANIIRYWEKISGKAPIPIIALTAHADNKVKNNCLLAGINEVFIKPLDEKLLQNILQWLQTKKDAKPLDGIESDSVTVGLGPDLPLTEEELFQLDSYAIFDEKDGIQKVGGEEALREILTILLERVIPEELAYIKTAYVTHNWGEVQRIAHKLKGGAVYCGTIRMAYACQYMERYRQAGHSKLLEELYQQLLIVIAQTQQAIRTWLID